MATVLIVEDQTDLREIWAEELSLLGNSVQGAVDGAEGWELLQQRPFDLVLLDIGLPKLEGLEVLENIRLKDRVTPVVIVTAVTDPSMVRAAFQSGATEILFKPITLDVLGTVVTRLTQPPAP